MLDTAKTIGEKEREEEIQRNQTMKRYKLIRKKDKEFVPNIFLFLGVFF